MIGSGKQFLRFDALPELDKRKEGDKLPRIYEVAFSQEWKDVSLLMLMNEIRGANPESGSNEEIRATLAKVKTLAELVDIQWILDDYQKQRQEASAMEEDDTPDMANEPDAYLDEEQQTD